MRRTKIMSTERNAMKTRITTLVTLFIVIFACSANTHAFVFGWGESKMRKDWAKEKKQARKAFKKAYKDFIKGMPKKKAKAMLKQLGLKYGDNKLDDYVKFNNDFGPSIDKLVAHKKIEVEIPDIDTIIEDKKLWKVAAKVAERVHEPHSWQYYTRDYAKMTPKKIFETYLSGNQQINISGYLRGRWNKASKLKFDNNEYKKVYKQSLKELAEKTYKEKYAWESLCDQIRESDELETYLKTQKAKSMKLDYKVIKTARKLALDKCESYDSNIKGVVDIIRSGIKDEKDDELKKELEEESEQLIKELEDLQKELKKIAAKIKKLY